MKITRQAFAIAFLLFALAAAPVASAQATLPPPPPLESVIVGENNPITPPSLLTNVGGMLARCTFANYCAQAFSVGSEGAYVNRIRLGLIGENLNSVHFGVPVPTVCTFEWVITDGVYGLTNNKGNSDFGTIFATKIGTITIPANTTGSEVSVALPFEDGFPSVWLPSGSYYLVFENTTTLYSCVGSDYEVSPITLGELDWSLDASGSSAIGTVGPSYWFLPTSALNAPFAFDLDGPIITLPPTGGSKFEKSRLIVEGPVTPPAGGPVEAQVGFANAETGVLLGQLQQVTLNPGQLESVDLDLTPYVARVGQRIEVQPVIVQSPNAAGALQPGPVQISATLQTLDEFTGFQAVSAPVLQPGASVPGLAPQILAGGQTMRFDVLASPFDSCVAQVGFNDANGNPLIPSVLVNLAPGTGTTVDLNANALGFGLGREIEVQPVLTPTAPAAAVAQNSVCIASVEVFDHLTGRTWSHQSTMAGLPAVQSPAGGTPGTPASAQRAQ